MSTQLEWLIGRYISIRPRSETEIRRYIEQKRKKLSVTDEYVETVIEKFRNLGYIDDEKFVEALSHSIVTNKAKGKRFLSAKLFQAGVEKELVTKALKELDPESVTVAMEKRLRKTERRWEDLDKRMVFAKAYKVLLSAGFSSSEIRPFLDEWLQKR